MRSLISRKFATEIFSWQWHYYFLTTEGITYLREYLGLSNTVIPNIYKFKTEANEEEQKEGGEDEGKEGGEKREGEEKEEEEVEEVEVVMEEEEKEEEEKEVEKPKSKKLQNKNN